MIRLAQVISILGHPIFMPLYAFGLLIYTIFNKFFYLRSKLITSGKNILYKEESKNNFEYMNQIIDKFRYKRITWGD